jgi:hypothetical protein
MMKKYIMEENINFYDELYKSLDSSDDENKDNKIKDYDEINECQITGLPLGDKSVTLECKHNFNYIPLYREICKQKFEFKSYEFSELDSSEKEKLLISCNNFFIRCPYCRNIQFTILPYYEELNLNKIYGINTLDPKFYTEKYIFKQQIMYNGLLVENGRCSALLEDNTLCKEIMVTTIPNTNITYCMKHYNQKLANYNYVKELVDRQKNTNGQKKTCSSILKTGKNKGSLCSGKIYSNGLCKRHVLK